MFIYAYFELAVHFLRFSFEGVSFTEESISADIVRNSFDTTTPLPPPPPLLRTLNAIFGRITSRETWLEEFAMTMTIIMNNMIIIFIIILPLGYPELRPWLEERVVLPKVLELLASCYFLYLHSQL